MLVTPGPTGGNGKPRLGGFITDRFVVVFTHVVLVLSVPRDVRGATGLIGSAID